MMIKSMLCILVSLLFLLIAFGLSIVLSKSIHCDWRGRFKLTAFVSAILMIPIMLIECLSIVVPWRLALFFALSLTVMLPLLAAYSFTLEDFLDGLWEAGSYDE